MCLLRKLLFPSLLILSLGSIVCLGYFRYTVPMIESMIFFPEKTLYEKPEDYGFPYEDVRIPVKPGVELHAWYLLGTPSKSTMFNHEPGTFGRGTVLFFHGNAGNISNRLYKVKGWLERGFSVMLVDYRGYGNSSGKIETGEDVVEDASAAYQWLTKEKKKQASQIILYGESLGSHPAIRLGCEYPVAAVVLEAPFTSLFDVARTHYPFVFKEMMKKFEFSNSSYISGVKAPVFILHGEQDEICPYAMAGELFDKAPEPKGFLSIPDGRHNDLPTTAGDDFWQKPYEFLVKNAGIQ